MYMDIFGQGYNGSQLWDVVFAVQAILATDLVDEYGSVLKKAHDFIKNSQVWYSVYSFILFFSFISLKITKYDQLTLDLVFNE